MNRNRRRASIASALLFLLGEFAIVVWFCSLECGACNRIEQEWLIIR